MKNLLSLFSGLFILMYGCTNVQKQEVRALQITNSSDFERQEVVNVSLSAEINGTQVKLGGEIVPAEFEDKDGDGQADQVKVLVSLKPGETKIMEVESAEVKPKFGKMTQAELSIKKGGEWTDEEYVGGNFVNLDFLRVPDQHTDHTYFIRYEGPGWESDKIAYRFYLDWRNGMDVFGKMKAEPVLQNVGQDGFDSYHELSDWGMDLLKVGKTLGGGSVGRFVNDTLYRFKQVDSVTCRIAKNGLLESEILTNYYGWSDGGKPTNLTSSIGIQAGSGLTAHQLQFSQPIDGFCTGLVKNDDEEYWGETIGAYRVLATYGNYSLNNDQMGLAVVVKSSDVESVVDGAGSHVVLFKPSSELTYYLIAVWEKGVAPVQSMEEFKMLMKKEVAQLNSPLEVVLAH